MNAQKTAKLTYFAILWAFVVFEVLFQYRAYQETGILGIYHKDFANYWMVAKAYFSGTLADVFDVASYMEMLRDEFGSGYSEHNWSYPPTFILLCLPLYPFGYELAYVLYLTITFALFFWATGKFFSKLEQEVFDHKGPWANPMFLTLMLAFIFCNIRFAQNGFLISAIFLLALSYWRSAPILAGLFLGFLTVKPQLGVLLPLFLILDRNWKMFLSASATTIILLVLSLIVFGTQAWLDYIHVSIPLQSAVLTELGEGSFYPSMMLSGFMSARILGMEGIVAWAVHSLFAVPAIALSVWTFSTSSNWFDKAVAMVLGTFLVVPYTFNYDAGVLSVLLSACAVKASAEGSRLIGENKNVPRSLNARTALFAVAAVLPVVGFQLNHLWVPISPAVLLLCLISISPLGVPLFKIVFDRPINSHPLSPVSGSD